MNNLSDSLLPIDEVNFLPIRNFYEEFLNDYTLLDDVWLTSNFQVVKKTLRNGHSYKLLPEQDLSKLIDKLTEISPRGRIIRARLEDDFLHSYVLTCLIVLKNFKTDNPKRSELINQLENVPLPSVGIENKEVLEILKTFIQTEIEGNIEPINLKARKTSLIAEKPISYETIKACKIKYLCHQTSPKNLISILKMQKIVPAASVFIPGIQQVFGGGLKHGNKFVFMSAVPKLTSQEYEALKDDDERYKNHFELNHFSERVALIFSNKVLVNRDDYHYSLGANFGEKIDKKYLDAKDIGRLSKHSGSTLLRENEVVFYNPVDLTNLKEIWVLPENREEFIQLLKENNIQFANDPNYTVVKAVKAFPDSIVSKSV